MSSENKNNGFPRAGASVSTAGLLHRFLKVYWLKPFDAVNDAANAWALRQFPWQSPILEVGGGDGVFSFIMHDGKFIFTDDRYDQADPTRSGDIYDVHHEDSCLTVKRPASQMYEAGVDLKSSHITKCEGLGLYHSMALSAPDALAFAAHSFQTVFLYFPHGLAEMGRSLDYAKTLREIRRVLRPDGTLLMTAFNRDVQRYFFCYRLHLFFAGLGWMGLSRYFNALDGGRYREISGLGHTAEEWEILLRSSGFRLEEAWTHVHPVAWGFYDLQTRPVLRMLIRANGFLKRIGLKIAVKAISVYSFLPVLMVFYVIFAKPKRLKIGSPARMCFAFKAVPC